MDSEKGWTLLFWAMIIIGVLAILFRGAGVEQDLRERANAALHQNGLQWASVKEVSGRNVVITGESPVKAQRGWALNKVDNLYGVRSVDDEGISVKSPASPYIWAAIVATDKVTLTGSVPDENTRASILEKVANIISDRAVTDKMVLADGAPDMSWLENINNVLKYTKYLKNGAVHLNDRSVKVEGEAWNSLDFEVIALRASRGRTINDYKFSSDLKAPENSTGQSLITSAPSQDDVKEDETPNQPAVSEKPEGKPDAAKAGDADTAPSAAAPDTSAESSEPEDKAVDAKAPDTGTEPDAKSDDAAAPSPEPAKSADAAPAPDKESPAASDNAKSDKADAPSSKAETPDAAVTGEAKTKTADEKKSAVSRTVAKKEKQRGQTGFPLNIPRHMIAPPWAWAPYPAPPRAGYYQAPPAYYPARPAYNPNCGYGNPYAPAYCGRPAY